jgi:hypothetical protein
MLSACGGQRVEVINLNRVLDVMKSTLKEMDAKGGGAKIDPKDTAAVQKYMNDFNTAFAKNLNAAKLMKTPIGTKVEREGSILGFTDKNKNMQLDYGRGERRLFRVEIDKPKNRLIAADLQRGYYRDSGYHFSGTGLLAGMLIGHMLSRQSAAGLSSSRYTNSRMSPRNYHSGAVSRARAAARARARSRSRSGSFSRGK